MNRRSAISAINKQGALLVFPMDNRREPASLWSHFHPKEEMRWEWDEDGDDRVARLWRLRGDLSTTRDVVYTKWFRGRATYFSRELFTALLRGLNPQGVIAESLGADARNLLEILESESPLSTKELKRMSGMRGRANERAYEKALGALWSRLLIVAFGEVDDGAFPSLAVGATRVLFEDLWTEAFEMPVEEAEATITRTLPASNLFYRHFLKIREERQAPLKRQDVKARKTTRAVPRVVRFDDL